MKHHTEYHSPGVYMLRSKSNPDIYYIGSTVDLRNRMQDHITKLNNLRSEHLKIQSHVNKYGIDDLEFIVLKLCSIDHLEYYEQYYISELHPILNTHKFARCSHRIIKAQAFRDIGYNNYSGASLFEIEDELLECLKNLGNSIQHI